MPKIVFPPRAERKKLIEELRELEKTQGKEIASSELYQNYLAALNALDQKMETLYELGAMGMPKDVTAKDKKELLDLFVQVGNAGEQFLGDAQEKGQDLKTGLPQAVDKLQGMLAKDYQSIYNYNPSAKNMAPLSILQEFGRTKTIDLRGQNIKTMGNMQSSRIPMTFRGPNGEKRTGVFTKANYVSLTGPYLQKLEEAKALCGPGSEGAAELDSILSKARDYHVRMKAKKRDGAKLKGNEPDEYMVGYIMNRLRFIMHGKRDDELKTSHVKEYLNSIGVNTAKIPKPALEKLTAGLKDLQKQPAFEINGYGLELKEGTRLDQRNTAMSVVADLLGKGYLLAKSSNMRFVGDDGQVTEGTFMDYGKGLDLGGNMDSCIHLNKHPMKNKATFNNALRSIADLQIVDLICLNVDRHRGNVMYRVDEKGNFIGVQGIDNDSSFGLRDLSDNEITDVRVISESMAQRLNNMTPDMLKFALRGRGLSEQELKAAAERLETVKGAVAMGLIKTVKDTEFSKLDLEKDLLPPKGGDNMFAQAVRQLQESVKLREQRNLPFVPLRSETAPHLTDVSTTGRKHTVSGLSDLQEKVSLLIKNPKTNFKVEDLSGIRGSSEEFNQMVEAARVVQHAGEFLKSNDPDAPDRATLMLDDPRAQKSLKVYATVFGNLREKTMQYLGEKMFQRGAKTLDELTGKNPYEQKRIDYAKQMLSITEEFLDTVAEKPLTEEEREERSRLMELRSLIGRKEFKDHFEKRDQQMLEIGANLVEGNGEDAVEGNQPLVEQIRKENQELEKGKEAPALK